MGCDIHAHVEIKIKGKWYHYNELDIDRNYKLFSKMANVRNHERKTIKPISMPKGLPKDIAFVTKFKSDIYGNYVHSHSWLSSKEIYDLECWIDQNLGLSSDPVSDPVLGYFFDFEFIGWFKHPQFFNDLKKQGLEDFRLVFWFDN